MTEAASSKGSSEFPARETLEDARAVESQAPTAVAGVAGPGRWLVVEFAPTALFSLKISLATSSVGKTLVIPTPYATKMAFVDAAFRAGFSDGDCADFLRLLVGVDVRISPPEACVVTHTFVKIRQEPHGGSKTDKPYISSIAYRELVHHRGLWRWAFDLASGNDILAERLVVMAPYVSYIGKRGSFIQFLGVYRRGELDSSFTQIPSEAESWEIPSRSHVVPLDDFGPEATLEILSTYSREKAPKRDRHRRFTHTVVPLGITNTGPGFTEYRKE